MSEHAVTLLLIIFVPSGIAFGLATWLFRRKSQAQQRELHTLYAVAESMISASDMTEIYRRIVHTLQKMLQASHCYLLLYNRLTKQLDVLAGTDKFPGASIPLHAVSAEVACFRNKVLLEVPDTVDCPYSESAVVKRLGQKSVLYVPMASEGDVIGVLEIDERRRKRVFTEEQKACAQHIANLGALAMKLCEQRSMREQLYRSEKMAAVGELISGVAHDLKNPLASITGMTELALARAGEGSLSQDLRAIHIEAKNANTVLQRLISFARPQRVGSKVVDVNAVARSVLELRKEKWEQRGITVRVHLSPSVPLINSEPEHLEQIFLNLLINAEAALEQAREKIITVRTAIVARRVLISISDTGPGLTPEMQSRMFDRGRLQGTVGLGLAVCQSLIEGHGGSIRVHSTPGQVTTFEIEYPLATESAPEPAAPALRPAAAQPPPSSLTALVIDEDHKVQESLLSLLSDRHYRVIVVSSAEEALDLAERAWFDLVLCDTRVRGVGGIELYQRVRPRIQTFVFLTGDAFGDVGDKFAAGDQPVLVKPFTAADVERLLERIEPGMLEAHAARASEI